MKKNSSFYWLRAAGIIFILVLAFVVISCPVNDSPSSFKLETETVEIETVAVPVACPAGGRVMDNTVISLGTATAGTKIYYTLDGTEPDTASALYSETNKPKITAGKLTLKARAVKTGMADSEILTETYSLPRPYYKAVIPISFPPDSETTTVLVEGLTEDEVVDFIKVNVSDQYIRASQTGGVSSTFPSAGRNALSKLSFSEQTHSDSEFTPVKQQSSSVSRAASVDAPFVGDEKIEHFVDWGPLGELGVYEVHFELMAISRFFYLWIAKFQSYQSLENPREPPIKEFLSDVSYEQAAQIAARFDDAYAALNNLINYESFNSQTNEYGDSRLIAEVYKSKGTWAGYFSSATPDSIYLTHELLNSMDDATLVVLHEATHLMANRIKRMTYNHQDIPTWFSEALAYTSGAVCASLLGILTTSAYHPQQLMAAFVTEGHFNQYAFNETTSFLFAFMSYLLYNYGGPALFRDIIINDQVGYDSLTLALDKYQPGLTFEKAFEKFPEALIYSGPLKPVGALSFDKTVSSTINSVEYTIPGFDIFEEFGGPMVVSLTPADMRPYSVVIQSSPAEWEKRTGNMAITLQKPADDGIKFFLMVR